ncbi:hypothetical protein [Laceyella putida]|uniref:Uncharacterized protein n=1 Tax=Laceyella putida TaxID=110101 RepID=A0ABW2RP75_9BACL
MERRFLTWSMVVLLILLVLVMKLLRMGAFLFLTLILMIGGLWGIRRLLAKRK